MSEDSDDVTSHEDLDRLSGSYPAFAQIWPSKWLATITPVVGHWLSDCIYAATIMILISSCLYIAAIDSDTSSALSYRFALKRSMIGLFFYFVVGMWIVGFLILLACRRTLQSSAFHALFQEDLSRPATQGYTISWVQRTVYLSILSGIIGSVFLSALISLNRGVLGTMAFRFFVSMLCVCNFVGLCTYLPIMVIVPLVSVNAVNALRDEIEESATKASASYVDWEELTRQHQRIYFLLNDLWSNGSMIFSLTAAGLFAAVIFLSIMAIKVDSGGSELRIVFWLPATCYAGLFLATLIAPAGITSRFKDKDPASRSIHASALAHFGRCGRSAEEQRLHAYFVQYMTSADAGIRILGIQIDMTVLGRISAAMFTSMGTLIYHSMSLLDQL